MIEIHQGVNLYQCDKDGEREINSIKDIINKALNKYIENKYNIELKDLHNYIKKENINEIRISLFNEINKYYKEIEKSIEKIADTELVKILGPDILIQKKINLSIQMPNDETSLLDMHSDCWSGDTPYQINLWIPLTDSENTNSMFIFNFNKSQKIIKKIYEHLDKNPYDATEKIENKDFLKVKLGQYIIFNPGLLHGNVKNETDSTRVSINIRFKSRFTPEPALEHITRSSGIYYKEYKKSEWTKLAEKIKKMN